MTAVIDTLKNKIKELEGFINWNNKRIYYYNKSIKEFEERNKSDEREIRELTEAINKLQSEND